MAYFVTIDSSNNIVELFCDAEGYATPPSDAIAISDADGKMLSCGGFTNYSLENGAVVLKQPTPTLNPQGFITAVKAIFGGPVVILTLPQVLQNAILLCISAINEGNWLDVQAVIVSQEAALNAANVAIYPAIKAVATQYNIPITL